MASVFDLTADQWANIIASLALLVSAGAFAVAWRAINITNRNRDADWARNQFTADVLQPMQAALDGLSNYRLDVASALITNAEPPADDKARELGTAFRSTLIPVERALDRAARVGHREFIKPIAELLERESAAIQRHLEVATGKGTFLDLNARRKEARIGVDKLEDLVNEVAARMVERRRQLHQGERDAVSPGRGRGRTESSRSGPAAS